MANPKAARPSFSLRLQPYEGSLLAEVVQYLNSLDRAEAQRRVENVLVMALLSQARLYDESCSPQERRRCCIESCDALEKHASNLRQLIGVEASPAMRAVALPYEVATGANGDMAARQVMRSSDEGEDEEDESDVAPPKAKLNAKVAPDQVDALFGG